MLALHRLRVDGRLPEVRARDLDLTRAESVELLGKHDLELADDDLDLVLERTEGWAAGVRLGAMSLHGADPRGVLTTFAGDDRPLADYLVGEVLARHPPEVHDFLVQTSVCEHLSPDLAAAVSGRAEAGALLGDLSRSNALRALLVPNAGRFGRQDAFAARLLRARPPTGPGPAVRLTARERQVLVELPWLRTAEEIAEQQFVSANTVKTHMLAICRKLDVPNRREALAAARARGLL